MKNKNPYERKIQKLIAHYHMQTDHAVGKMSHDLDLLRSIHEENIVLWGAGSGDEERSTLAWILNKYGTYLQNVNYIIDSSPKLQGKSFLDIPIISPEEAAAHKEFTYVIPTAGDRSKKQIINQCQEIIPWCQIINLNNVTEKDYYVVLNQTKLKYELEKDSVVKEELLLELIKEYLQIRDFYYAFYYIDEYFHQGFHLHSYLQELKKDISNLLQEIKRKLQNRQNDVMICFIDTLLRDYMTDENGWQMFSYLKDKAFIFDHAYSVGFFTYEAMCGVIREKMPYEGRVYERDFAYQPEEFSLLQDFLKKDYEFKIYSAQGYPIIKGQNLNYSDSNYMTEKLWWILCDLCEAKKPQLILQYSYEAHAPLVCGSNQISTEEELEAIQSNCTSIKTYKEVLQYIDREFGFFYDFMPKAMRLVLFSDHGNRFGQKELLHLPYEKTFLLQELNTGVPLWIVGDITGHYRQWVSMIDFQKAVRSILFEHKPPILPERKYINAQLYPFHNKKWRKQFHEEGKDKYLYGLNIFYGKAYTYVKNIYEEEVYRNGDYEHNIASSEEGSNIIKEINSLYNTKIPEDLSRLLPD